MKISEKIKKLSDEKGMSQADLVRATKSSSAQVAYIFNGKTELPRIDTILELCDAFNVTIEEFLSDVEVGGKIRYHSVKLDDEDGTSKE